jgi:hypothetical protein
MDINRDGFISFEELVAGFQALGSVEDKSTPYGSSGQRLSSSSGGVSVDSPSIVTQNLSAAPRASRATTATASGAVMMSRHEEVPENDVALAPSASDEPRAETSQGRGPSTARESISTPGIPDLLVGESSCSVEYSLPIQDGGVSPAVRVSGAEGGATTWGGNAPRRSAPETLPFPPQVIRSAVASPLLPKPS